MEKKKNSWGGRREGAGRKSSGHGKYYGFNSTPQVEIILESVGKGKTAFINNSIELYSNLCESLPIKDKTIETAGKYIIDACRIFHGKYSKNTNPFTRINRTASSYTKASLRRKLMLESINTGDIKKVLDASNRKHDASQKIIAKTQNNLLDLPETSIQKPDQRTAAHFRGNKGKIKRQPPKPVIA